MHLFRDDIQHLPLPEQFTYPFHYTPHPLCVMATTEVQTYLQSRTDWHSELQHGKMFGVLIVLNPEGTIGYLAAFSGNLAGSNHHDFFVPPVYDLLNPDGYFKREEARISELSVILNEVKNLNTSTSDFQVLRSALDDKSQNNISLEQLKEERTAFHRPSAMDIPPIPPAQCPWRRRRHPQHLRAYSPPSSSCRNRRMCCTQAAATCLSERTPTARHSRILVGRLAKR